MTTRRGFLTTAGAVAGHEYAHAQGHDHDHEHQAAPSDLTLRVKALESLLVEKGLVDPAALDALIDTFEHKVGPRNGARVVARPGSIPPTRSFCSATHLPPLPSLATRADRASTSGYSRTGRKSITWSCALSAPVIPGRSSACRRSGINRRLIARAQ